MFLLFGGSYFFALHQNIEKIFQTSYKWEKKYWENIEEV